MPPVRPLRLLRRRVLASSRSSRAQYFQALVLHTSDVITIVDGRGVVRSQTGATRTLLPITGRGRVLGLLEAYTVAERPWSLAEIHRARLVADRLGATLALVAGERGASVLRAA